MLKLLVVHPGEEFRKLILIRSVYPPQVIIEQVHDYLIQFIIWRVEQASNYNGELI